LDNTENKEQEIILESSLQAYFYDQLQAINTKSNSPLPNESIYYSSRVMDRMGQSSIFFDVSEGKIRDKTLGLKLLECSDLSISRKKRALRDIGDTSLLICGYFHESLNRKLIDTRYYEDLGKIAYGRLNSLIPDMFDIPSFYNCLAHQFEPLTNIMSWLAKKSQEEQPDNMSLFVKDYNSSVS
jgi:hypothetical protein